MTDWIIPAFLTCACACYFYMSARGKHWGPHHWHPHNRKDHSGAKHRVCCRCGLLMVWKTETIPSFVGAEERVDTSRWERVVLRYADIYYSHIAVDGPCEEAQ